MQDDELLLGVIGAGGRGGLAGHAHKPEEGIRLVAAADIENEPLERFSRQYGPDALTTNDYRELLAQDDIGAVFVTSPDYLHEEHAVAALQAGKHVYLEKPMAITIKGCDRILETARKHNRKIYLGHNMRHMSFTRKMKQLIDDGAIGEVKTAWCRHFVCYGCDAYFKDWHADRRNSTGLLLQKAAHDIDIMHWFCNGNATRVNAMGNLTVYNRITDRREPRERPDVSWNVDNWPPLAQKKLNPVIDVEDLSMMLMRLDNDVLCSYQQCHYAPDGWRNYTVIGTEGRIENFGDSPGNCVIKVWNKRCYYNGEADEQHCIPHEKGGHGGADPRIVDEFIRYVREGGKIATSPVAARSSGAAGCAATHSLRNGGIPADIPPLPRDLAEHFNADVQDAVA